MRHLLAIAGLVALAAVASPAGQAAPVSLDTQVRLLPDSSLDYVKKGGKAGKKFKFKRGGPPPWAPAWGRRRR